MTSSSLPQLTNDLPPKYLDICGRLGKPHRVHAVWKLMSPVIFDASSPEAKEPPKAQFPRPYGPSIFHTAEYSEALLRCGEFGAILDLYQQLQAHLPAGAHTDTFFADMLVGATRMASSLLTQPWKASARPVTEREVTTFRNDLKRVVGHRLWRKYKLSRNDTRVEAATAERERRRIEMPWTQAELEAIAASKTRAEAQVEREVEEAEVEEEEVQEDVEAEGGKEGAGTAEVKVQDPRYTWVEATEGKTD